MKNQSDPDRLLDDILADAAPPEFRAEMLEQTLQQVRQRSRVRRWNRSIVVVTLVVSIPLLGWKLFVATPKSGKSPPPSFSLVRSQPLGPSLIVETKLGIVKIITSSPSTFAFVETELGKHLVTEINDDQLLALVAGRPAALVRQGPHQAELLFLNPEDQNGFPVQ
jgi:hypothetical protein